LITNSMIGPVLLFDIACKTGSNSASLNLVAVAQLVRALDCGLIYRFDKSLSI